MCKHLLTMTVSLEKPLEVARHVVKTQQQGTVLVTMKITRQ